MAGDRESPSDETRPLPDRPVLVLIGEDGNAFSILGRARQALRLAGRGDEWEVFALEATSGDYDRLLATVLDWFDVT